jgi:hypothetical protein
MELKTDEINDKNIKDIKNNLCKNFVIQCLMKLIEVNTFNDSDDSDDIIFEFNYDIASIFKNINVKLDGNEQIRGNREVDMDYKFISIKKDKKDFNECRYALLYKLYDHTNRNIGENYDDDFRKFKLEIDELNKYDNYFDEFLNMINFIKINQKFISLKDDNNIVGYAILDDKIYYPIVLQNYQKSGDMLSEFIKLINKEFSKSEILSPHNLNEAGFDYDNKL